jgi:hypothetical protein
MSPVTDKKLSEIKPLPWPDPVREVGAPEVSKSVFREVRELFQRITGRKKRDRAA